MTEQTIIWILAGFIFIEAAMVIWLVLCCKQWHEQLTQQRENFEEEALFARSFWVNKIQDHLARAKKAQDRHDAVVAENNRLREALEIKEHLNVTQQAVTKRRRI